MSAHRGSVNSWTCTTCGRPTVAVHVDDGVTPMFLGCRSTEGCTGRGTSNGYMPVPPMVVAMCEWEWYRPTGRQYRRLSPEMRQHVDAGGLDLRPLTDAGRALL